MENIIDKISEIITQTHKPPYEQAVEIMTLINVGKSNNMETTNKTPEQLFNEFSNRGKTFNECLIEFSTSENAKLIKEINKLKSMIEVFEYDIKHHQEMTVIYDERLKKDEEQIKEQQAEIERLNNSLNVVIAMTDNYGSTFTSIRDYSTDSLTPKK